MLILFPTPPASIPPARPAPAPPLALQEIPQRTPRKSILKPPKRASALSSASQQQHQHHQHQHQQHPAPPLPHSVTDRFPLELFRLIIDFLHSDPCALAACSAVCRAWLPLCRAHFGRRMTVAPANAPRFLDIVRSPHLSLHASVRHLVVHKQQALVDHFFLVAASSPSRFPTPAAAAAAGSGSGSAVGAGSPPAAPPLSLTHILHAARSLSHLTKLTIQKGYGENADIASCLAGLRTLEDLELRSCEFRTFADLTAVLSAQQGLRRLSLTDIAWGLHSSSRSSNSSNSSALPPLPWPWPSYQNPNLGTTAAGEYHRPPPQLRRLQLFMERQAQFFDWFLAPSASVSAGGGGVGVVGGVGGGGGGATPPTIEHVELGGIMELDDAIAVSRFLRGLGPVLKHLRLYSPNRISQVNLVHNTQLQSVKISHLHMGGAGWRANLNLKRGVGVGSSSIDGNNNNNNNNGDGLITTSSTFSPPADEVCMLLAQLCSPSLSTISLQLLLNEPEALTSIDWPQVARTLALPRYQNLVLIQFRIPKLRRWMAASIAKHLPDAEARGILSVANG